MKLIYIVDDDISIINILEDIIKNNFENYLIDSALSANIGIEGILKQRPDIILLDYLLPDKDGLQIIREIKKVYNPLIVMISEVSDKEMIAKAYNEKIEFFITKPINVIEVVSVINKLVEYQEMKTTVNQVKNVMNKLNNTFIEDDTKNELFEDKIKNFYSKIGILGSTGCDELIESVKWVKERENKYTLSEMYLSLSEELFNKKQIYLVKKRIRRIITKSFISMAALGNEDYMNPVFEKYSNQLFDFVELRVEMKYLKKESNKVGRINIRKFIESSIIICDEIN